MNDKAGKRHQARQGASRIFLFVGTRNKSNNETSSLSPLQYVLAGDITSLHAALKLYTAPTRHKTRPSPTLLFLFIFSFPPAVRYNSTSSYRKYALQTSCAPSKTAGRIFEGTRAPDPPGRADLFGSSCFILPLRDGTIRMLIAAAADPKSFRLFACPL